MKTEDQAAVANQTLNRVGQCLYRSEQSGIYYGVIKRSGKQIKKSLKTTDKALAKRRLANLQDKAARMNVGEAGKITFQGISKRWHDSTAGATKPSSHHRQGTVIASLNKFFGPSLVRSMSKVLVEQWSAKRGREVAGRTFNYERQVLIRVLDYATREGLLLDNPARIIKRQKQNRATATIPTKAQFKTLIEGIRELKSTASEAANLCEFLAYSGCRLGEALAMRWEDIDTAQGFFVVTGGERGTKNHEARVVPLFPALKQFLEFYRANCAAEVTPAHTLFTIQSAKTAITSACHRKKLPRFTHHHLRHFFCSNAIEAGIDFKAIAGWLGHKDGGLLVAKTYGHLRDEHSAAMAKRMSFTITSHA
jgi:integrase